MSSSLNNLLPEHFKPVRQCLRQMDLLKNVWQTILPIELYSNTIGNLLDVLCSDLARKICIMEDISTTLSTGLVDLIKVINEKGTLLFEVSGSKKKKNRKTPLVFVAVVVVVLGDKFN